MPVTQLEPDSKSMMKTKLTLFVTVLAVALFGVGCASTKPAFTIVGVDHELALPLMSDGKGNLPWTNRDYRFIDIPEELTGYKYYQYEARSGKGVTLNIQKKTKVTILVGADTAAPRDLEAITKWENEGWEKIDSKLLYGPEPRTPKMQILQKSVDAGKLRINDYSEFGGIIVLTK